MVKVWIIGEEYLWRSGNGRPQRVTLKSAPGPFGYRGIKRKATAPALPDGPRECEVELVSGGPAFFVPATELSVIAQ